MGIDIYAYSRDPGEPQEEPMWSTIDSGNKGYLREAYHGEPYATKYLVLEAFQCPEGALIPAQTLRRRLPETLRLAGERTRKLYPGTSAEVFKATLQSFRDFVEFCEQVELRTGRSARIVASW
jgi:hypothetical protein